MIHGKTNNHTIAMVQQKATKIGMDIHVSRSEKKRRAKNVEKLVQELASLSPAEIKKLPCDGWLQEEIQGAAQMKGGALKRQIKFITKNLRTLDPEPLFEFMAQQKGSRLQEKKEFHELERIRDSIIDDALAADRDAKREDREIDPQYYSAALEAAGAHIADLDREDLRRSALRYARTRKAAYSREIFRILKAASERQKWQETTAD